MIMQRDFLIVHKDKLPDYFEKVIEAREMLESHEAATVTEAAEKAGISRNTYYKYKDFVFAPGEKIITHRAVISLILVDQSGALSSVIQILSEHNTNILTISQAVPVAGKANVLISLDITGISCTIETLVSFLKENRYVRRVHLDARD